MRKICDYLDISLDIMIFKILFSKMIIQTCVNIMIMSKIKAVTLNYPLYSTLFEKWEAGDKHIVDE